MSTSVLSLFILFGIARAAVLPIDSGDTDDVSIGFEECCGGGGDQSWSDEVMSLYGNITGYRVWHGGLTCLIDGIQFKYGNLWGERHGSNGTPRDTVSFQDGEYIIAVEWDRRDHFFMDAICKLKFYTNVRTYGPYCDFDCKKGRCEAAYGPFRYASGRHGVTTDCLRFHR